MRITIGEHPLKTAMALNCLVADIQSGLQVRDALGVIVPGVVFVDTVSGEIGVTLHQTFGFGESHTTTDHQDVADMVDFPKHCDKVFTARFGYFTVCNNANKTLLEFMSEKVRRCNELLRAELQG